MFTLSRKNYLGKTLMKLKNKFSRIYNFIPRTFILPK